MTSSTTSAALFSGSKPDPIGTKILLVSKDASSADPYARVFPHDGIQVVLTSSADALRELRSDRSIDLVLIDGASEQTECLELCRRIKQDHNLSLTPVVGLLSQEQSILRKVGIRWGLDDCLTVPDQIDELLHRCKNLVRTKHATDVLENSEQMIYTLARLIEGRDKYTQGHVERVSTYAVQLGYAVDLPEEDILTLKKGGIVHDLGKIIVPDGVLNKPGPLDEGDELECMRRHPVVGYDLLAPLRTFRSVLPLVRWHHERPNGTGYPDGIGGSELSILVRIIAVADCFDALTTTRPYRGALSIETSLDILRKGGKDGDFDAEVVESLAELCSHQFLGEVLAAQQP